MFYTYILQSGKDHSYYIGYTKNLQQRLHKHNTAKKGYTATKQPWALAYFEKFETKAGAIERERFLKAQKNRDFYKKLIAGPVG